MGQRVSGLNPSSGRTSLRGDVAMLVNPATGTQERVNLDQKTSSAPAQTPRETKDAFFSAVNSDDNINISEPRLKRAMNDAPDGFYIEFETNSYHSDVRDRYAKDNGKWELTHYSTNNSFDAWTTKADPSDLWNTIHAGYSYNYGMRR